jgi:hypothetical protein
MGGKKGFADSGIARSNGFIFGGIQDEEIESSAVYAVVRM